MPIPAGLEVGAFVPTSTLYDVNQIQQTNINSPEFKQLIIKLRESINQIALVLNIKDTGYYVLQEFVNGQAWFPDPALDSTTSQTPVLRQDFRLVINFGALPNAATKAVAHGLTPQAIWSATRIYAVATDPALPAEPAPYWIPIPYFDVIGAGANNIELSVGITNVSITTASNMTRFTTCYVVLEYLKQ